MQINAVLLSHPDVEQAAQQADEDPISMHDTVWCALQDG